MKEQLKCLDKFSQAVAFKKGLSSIIRENVINFQRVYSDLHKFVAEHFLGQRGDEDVVKMEQSMSINSKSFKMINLHSAHQPIEEAKEIQMPQDFITLELPIE